MADRLAEVYKEFAISARALLDDEIGLHAPDGPFSYQFGSPIEEILFWSFAGHCQDRSDNVTMYNGFDAAIALPDDGDEWTCLVGLATQIGHRNHTNPDDYRVVTQCRIGRYKADFLIEILDLPSTIRVVVECDGHDYHERTKAQAAHDRSRDRYMQTRGLAVLRFTGSEIHADPYKCAKQITEFLDAARAKARK